MKNIMNGKFIFTHSGKKFEYDNLSNQDYNVYDIAHSLARQSRFLGHTKRYYSISEHSRLVALLLADKDPLTQLVGLLHDIAEAYLGDIPTPLKVTCPEFKNLEYSILQYALPALINKPFSKITQLFSTVKNADLLALSIEAHELMAHPNTYLWVKKTHNKTPFEHINTFKTGLSKSDTFSGEANLFLTKYTELLGEL